ncbi:MAG: SusC/RagA family TonB-linked outer membrane protein [Saprospiraceae bacterium]
MKKLYLALFWVFVSVSIVAAQRTVTGTVTDTNGEALIGASILVKGTTSGTVTDIDGSYTLNLPNDATTLVFSYTGFATQEIGLNASSVYDVTLEEGVALSEVVITGLGIERDKKSVGYSVQDVNGETLNPLVNDNVVEALGGKAAGIQVINASGASLGGTSKIRIRGATGLRGGQPLFVVDGTPISNANFSSADELTSGRDYGSLINDLNSDDVESISVLKGPAATAIYGERGKHGVVLVTMKKGKKNKGIGVTVNTSVTADKVYILPNYQNEYGGGYTQDFLIDAASGDKILNYAADESWGPRMDGTMYRPWWSWYPNTPEYGTEIPLSPQPDNVRDFFDTGMTYNNSVAIEGGTEKTTFRLSYKNVNQTGIIPNSQVVQNNVAIAASHDVTDRLTVSTNLNISGNNGLGRPKYGYAGDNVLGSFNQWFQRQLDMDRLRDYKNADGTFRSWNIRSTTDTRPLYWDSPFFSVYENYSTDSRDRYFGNVRASYKLTDHFTLSGSLNRDHYTQRIEERTATGGLELDYYSEQVATGTEDNYDLRLDYIQNFGDFSLDANVGGNIRKNTYHNNYGATSGGLNAPNLFNLSASIDRPTLTSYISEKRVNSIFGAANLGFKDFLYIGGTLRNDWSSSLPLDNNSYLYPSLGVSVVFSELLGTNNFLSFGKIRASVAQVGSDTDPYQTAFVYSSQTPYSSYPTFTLPNALVNTEILPSLSTSWEVGLEMNFFQNRIGFDFAYYDTKNTNEIITLTVPGSSGFSSALINAGEIESKGVELMVTATPIQTRDFTWDLTFNIGANTNQVNELTEGLDNIVLDGRMWGGLTINAPVGQEWGQFRGRKFRRDAQGNYVINEDGSYVYDSDQWLGGFLPDATGGFRTQFTYKGFRLGAFVDFQMGGQFMSTTKMWGTTSGLAAETVGNNDKGNPIRDPVGEGGGVRVDGVLEDGTPTTVYVDAQEYFGGLAALHERFLYDASYVKLREVSLGYSLPTKMLENLPISSINITLVGKNLWLIHSNVEGIDPGEISPGSNAYVFQEGGILPGVRSYGISLRLGF